jgi:mono/diheme cytochrome c family protein
MDLTRRAFAVTLCAAALAGLVAWGCGGGSKSAEQTAGQTPPPAATSQPATAGGGDLVTSTGTYAAADIEAGAKIYSARCALCHGSDGRGDGPGAAALNPKPRNHHDSAYMKTRTDQQLLEVLHNGKGQMPKWQGILSEEEMRQVLAYVRKLGETP